MFDHSSIGVKDLTRARLFYDAALPRSDMGVFSRPRRWLDMARTG